ncbi:MAG: hypothetical protein JKY65_12320 [Planctomycetes bacterium]|nr:hypothetical protein [Planctomycetota bacterium]
MAGRAPAKASRTGATPRRAKVFLEGVELARDGRWPEATRVLTRALRAEGAAASQASGDTQIQAAWSTFVAVLDKGDLKDTVGFTMALEAWASGFTRKDLEGPATLNKKS